jgi:hypothetical protein
MMQNARKRTFGRTLPDAFSSVTSNRLISILTLLVILAAIPVTILLINHQTKYMGKAAGTNDLFVSTSGSDSNPCTQSSPCATISHAATLVSAGTTVHVAPGTYSEGEIKVSASGTSSAPITFVSDTPLAAKVADSSWHAFYITGNYITIKGFEIYMTNPNNASDIIDMLGANYASVLGNYVHDWDNGSNAPCYGGSAINSHPATGLRIIGNRIAHGGPTSTACNQMHGVYIAGDSNVVANNIAWDISGWCYQAWPTMTNSQIMNNDGDNCRSGGIIMGWDGSIQPQTNNDVVGNNIIRSVGGYGIRDCCSGVPPGTNMHYLDNDVYGATDGNYFFYQSASVNTGGLSADPQYVNWISGGGGDYHLQAASPMIGKGTATDAPSTDFAGYSRPLGAGTDIGAYEYLSGITATPTPGTLTPTPNGSSCLASTAAWQNQAIASKIGTFEAQFDVTPASSGTGGVFGFSQNAATAYTDLAAIGSISPNNAFTAINGSTYLADNTVTYTAGSTYHFRMDINIPNHTYFIYVTPPGSSEVTLGANYAFRTGQAGSTSLNYLDAITTTGSVNICNLKLGAISTIQPIPIPTSIPTPTPAPTNLIQNGSFENSGANWLSPWGFQANTGATISHVSGSKVDGLYSAKTYVKIASSVDSAVQLYQGSVPLIQGKSYTITFWAKSGKTRTIRPAVLQGASPWTSYFSQSISLTTSWQKFTFSFTSPQTDSNAMLLFNLANATGYVWIDAVSLQ